MADRGDIHERLATLESAVSDLKDEKVRARDKLHKYDNLLTAHGNNLEWIRPLVEQHERAYQRIIGIILIGTALGGLGGVALAKLFHVG